MSDGAAFQSWFAQAITAPAEPADLPPSFAVYRNTWLKGLLDALVANYPTVAMLLGPESFKAVAIEYAREHPPDKPVLALYGAGFPGFLRLHQLGHEVPYLHDIATLDRLWTECFFAPDAPALDSQDYARLRPAELLGLHVRLHPATRMARFETPAVTIWLAHRVEGEFEELEPEWQAERALVARQGMAVTVTLIDDSAFAMLAAIRNGRSLGAAITSAAEAHAGSDLAGALTTIIASGALTPG